jgi:hypothetical protein
LGIDLDSGTVGAWVDGEQKVSAKPFYQAATQLDAIDLTGYSGAQTASYIDNLKGAKSGSYLLGDLNNDGNVDLFDVLRLVDLLLGRPPAPSEYELLVGDIDQDGDIGLFDALALVDVLLAD